VQLRHLHDRDLVVVGVGSLRASHHEHRHGEARAHSTKVVAHHVNTERGPLGRHGVVHVVGAAVVVQHLVVLQLVHTRHEHLLHLLVLLLVVVHVHVSRGGRVAVHDLLVTFALDHLLVLHVVSERVLKDQLLVAIRLLRCVALHVAREIRGCALTHCSAQSIDGGVGTLASEVGGALQSVVIRAE
jgi:hypothetical protein